MTTRSRAASQGVPLKALAATFSTLPRTVTRSSAPQPENAPFPMANSPTVTVRSVRLPQL